MMAKAVQNLGDKYVLVNNYNIRDKITAGYRGHSYLLSPTNKRGDLQVHHLVEKSLIDTYIDIIDGMSKSKLKKVVKV
jgi:hypothetical protein